MSSTDRDTHFAGYAKLLYEKLKPDLNSLFVALGTPSGARRDHEIEWSERLIQGVIAESTYDFVKYVTENTKASTLGIAHFYFDESVSDIPDMTAWPETG